MIISVAVQAYLARIGELLKEQGFDPAMSVIYDAEQAQTDEQFGAQAWREACLVPSADWLSAASAIWWARCCFPSARIFRDLP